MNSLDDNSSIDRPAQAHGGRAAPTNLKAREDISGDAHESSFVRFLVHELRNMLGPIRNAAHVVRLRGAADANLRPIAEIMERQIEGIGRLLTSLVETERVRSGEAALEVAPVDLAAIVKDAVRANQAVIDSRSQRLRVKLPESPVSLPGDAARLAQVIGSVLENAAKYTQEGGEITVELATGGGEVEVRVRDNGSGMSPDLLRRAFEFYAASKADRMGKSGLGTSLAVGRRLVELHGGCLTAQSPGSGGGTEIVMRLPLPAVNRSEAGLQSVASAAGRADTSQTAGAVPSRRVLIADDNAAMRDSLSSLLQDLGHVVRAASDGEAALEAAEDWLPEFVFLDMNMPKLSGADVARRLRSRFPASRMTLIMMSGADLDEPTLRGARRAGFDHCIDKIGDPQLLGDLLREAPAARPAIGGESS